MVLAAAKLYDFDLQGIDTSLSRVVATTTRREGNVGLR